jgi:hypothetical protein
VTLEPLQYLLRREFEFLQQLSAWAGFFFQNGRPEAQWFYFAVKKLGLKSFRGIECTLSCSG